MSLMKANACVNRFSTKSRVLLVQFITVIAQSAEGGMVRRSELGLL